MSVLDQVKSTLKTKQGKVIAAGAVGGLAYLYWSRGRTATTATTDTTGTTGTTTTTDRVPGAVGGGGTTDTGTGRPTTNQQWLDQCVSALTNPPYNYDSAAVYNALRAALDGLMLTAGQQAIVSRAISIKGTPPEGMPPLNATPPPAPKPPWTPAPKPPTTTNPTPVTPTPAPTPAPKIEWGTVLAGWNVDGWIADYRRDPRGKNPNLTRALLQQLNPTLMQNVTPQNTFRAYGVYRVL